MYIHKYVPSHIILPHCVSVTLVTIITVSYNKNTISIEITVQKCMKKKHTLLNLNVCQLLTLHRFEQISTVCL